MSFREHAAFMDRQVDLWMDQLALDPELEVPHSVLKYFFHRSCDVLTIPTVLVPRQRRPFGGRVSPEEAER